MHVFSLHDDFLLLLLIFPLLDLRAVDMRYVESHIYCSRFPLYRFPLYCSCFPLYCSMLSTEIRSYYPVTRIMYCIYSCYIVYLTYRITKITWVWGRLDGWLDHIGWMSGSIVRPTAGDGVVLATICYSWASRYCFSTLRFPLHVTALAGWPWSQQLGIW